MNGDKFLGVKKEILKFRESPWVLCIINFFDPTYVILDHPIKEFNGRLVDKVSVLVELFPCISDENLVTG